MKKLMSLFFMLQTLFVGVAGASDKRVLSLTYMGCPFTITLPKLSFNYKHWFCEKKKVDEDKIRTLGAVVEFYNEDAKRAAKETSEAARRVEWLESFRNKLLPNDEFNVRAWQDFVEERDIPNQFARLDKYDSDRAILEKLKSFIDLAASPNQTFGECMKNSMVENYFSRNRRKLNFDPSTVSADKQFPLSELTPAILWEQLMGWLYYWNSTVVDKEAELQKAIRVLDHFSTTGNAPTEQKMKNITRIARVYAAKESANEYYRFGNSGGTAMAAFTIQGRNNALVTSLIQPLITDTP